MKIEDIELGKRVYHFAFGWCKIDAPRAVGEEGKEKILVDLEADEIEYYVMGQGRKSFQRNLNTGKHILLTPVSELLLTDDLPKGDTLALQILALSPKLTFWDDKNKIHLLILLTESGPPVWMVFMPLKRSTFLFKD